MDKYAETMMASFVDEFQKIAASKQAGVGLKVLLPTAVAGAAGWEALRRANDDRRMGRQMRMQSNF